jgi:alpha-glucosidase
MHGDEFAWLEGTDDVIAFTRGDGFACVVNFGADSIELPPGAVLLSSVALEDGRLPADTAAWITLG